jgi:hemolysin III
MNKLDSTMEHAERLNTFTHFAGLLLAAAGIPVLLFKASDSSDVLKLAAAAGFSAAILLLYASSTLYHGSIGARKAKWAVVDHCAIYVLIAGTYLPFGLVVLHGPWSWALMGLVAVLALAGIGNE